MATLSFLELNITKNCTSLIYEWLLSGSTESSELRLCLEVGPKGGTFILRAEINIHSKWWMLDYNRITQTYIAYF